LSVVLRVFLVSLVVFLVSFPVSAASTVSGGSEGGSGFLSVVFLGPVEGGSGWRVVVNASGGFSCSGVVGVNPGFLEARSVSGGLVVLPLYYVLSSVCGGERLALLVDALGSMSVVNVSFVVPSGFVVRSGLDWRGFGGLGGPYRVPGVLLRRFYLFEGVVVASVDGYVVRDYGSLGFSVVVSRGAGGLAGVVARVASGVAESVSGWLGASPRSPVVAVVVSPGELQWLAPGTAYSLGGVFVVVLPSESVEEGWLVHVVAHEAVHGWFNDGLVYGDFSFSEAVVELLALRGLLELDPGLFSLASGFAGSGVDAGEPYSVWLRVHLLLWLSVLKHCGRDVYMEVLAGVFNESVSGGSFRVYSLVDLVSGVERLCGSGAIVAWARGLPSVRSMNVSRALAEAVALASGARRAGGVGVSAASPVSSTVTVTVTVGSTSTVTVTRTVSVTSTVSLTRVLTATVTVSSTVEGSSSGGVFPRVLLPLVVFVLLCLVACWRLGGRG